MSCTDIQGCTALMHAVLGPTRNRTAAAQMLLDAAESPAASSLADNEGANPLLLATCISDPDPSSMAVPAACEHPANVFHTSSMVRTLLHHKLLVDRYTHPRHAAALRARYTEHAVFIDFLGSVVPFQFLRGVVAAACRPTAIRRRGCLGSAMALALLLALALLVLVLLIPVGLLLLVVGLFRVLWLRCVTEVPTLVFTLATTSSWS